MFLGAEGTMKSQANMSRFPKDPEMRAKLILMFVIRRWCVRNILLRSSLFVLKASQGTMTPY